MHYALYNTTTGQLISIGTVLPDPVPDGMAVLTRASEPTTAEMWDAASRNWVARPAKVLIDRLQDLLSDPDFADLWNNINAARRTKLRNLLIRLLGRHRYRAAGETLELE